MQIYIPVTSLKKLEAQGQITKYTTIHPQAAESINKQIQQNSQLVLNNIDGEYFDQQKNCPQPQDNKKYSHRLDLNRKMISNNQKHDKNIESQSFDQKCQTQLQKKSTMSQFHEESQKNIQKSSNQQSSLKRINLIRNNSNFKTKKLQIEGNLQTQSDILTQDQTFCKICLQSKSSSSYDGQLNPICKVCYCTDYIHLKCLEEWITRRDILNQQIQLDQCQICLKTYQVQITYQSFLSCKIFMKNIDINKSRMICRLIPSLSLLILLIFSLYALIALLMESETDGGKVRQWINMPYGTCIAITIFILAIVLLVFIVFLYSWINQFCQDLRYKIFLNRSQKIQSKLKKMLRNFQ